MSSKHNGSGGMTLGLVIHNILPDDETATIEELCRPISADVQTRGNHFFGMTSGQQSEAGRVGAMTIRMNNAAARKQVAPIVGPRPATKIDHDDVLRLTKDGLSTRQISDKYGVRPGTISRILRRYGDG